jgi:protein-histidine pros-kinase
VIGITHPRGNEVKLSLTAKFNLVLLVIFAIGFGAAAYISNALLLRNAREEVLQNARILMESGVAVRAYTSKQIKPLLANQLKYTFLPQSVPSYSAMENLQELRKKFPEYSYKEATLNPTNPRDRATGWEVDVVQQLRNDPDRPELIGDRDDVIGTGPAIFIAKPIRINDAECLTCHSTVDAAPKTMIDAYGTGNGFGWQFKETVGAQIVSVPVSYALQRAHNALVTFLVSLLAIFLAIFVIFNVMLRVIVTRPVIELARLADAVSMGQMDAPEFTTSGSDEVARLGESFNRMRASLVSALKLLEE